MLVLFDFEKVQQMRDNRTREKVLEGNPVSLPCFSIREKC